MSGGGAGEKDPDKRPTGPLEHASSSDGVPLSRRVDLSSTWDKREEPSRAEQVEAFRAHLADLRRMTPALRQGAAPPLMGLGDLLRAVAELGLGEEEARIAASAMGLRPPPRPQMASPRGPESRARQQRRPPPIAPVEERPPVEPAPEPLTPSPGTQLILDLAGTDERELPAFLLGVAAHGVEVFSEKNVTLRLPSLFEPAWVRGLIVTLLSTETKDGAVDMARLVALVAEGQAVTQLPQLGRFSLRRGAQVLVDESADMMPFSADATQICGTIRALAAGAPVMIVRSESGCPEIRGMGGERQSAAGEGLSGVGKGRIGVGAPDAQAPSMVIHDDGEERAYKVPMRGVPIVAVTDLGLRSPDRAGEWLRFAVAARRAGCPLIALTPYPKSRWPRAVAKRIAIVPWDRRTRVSAVRREARGAARSVS